jgi:hypothetical protein
MQWVARSGLLSRTQNRRVLAPRYEPEVVAAEARKHWRGDDEKAATTSKPSIEVDGVTITSRYGKAHEIERMGRMIEALAPRQRSAVASIFCNS